jgi:hypothetical protein
VDDELARMGEQAALAKLGRFEVTGTRRTLSITIRDQADEILGTRQVEAPDDCAQRASLAAVVLAAWAASWGQTTLEPRSAPAPSVHRHFEIAGWASGHHDGDVATFGVGLGAGLQVLANWGLALSAEMLGQRQVGLGPGQATYSSLRIDVAPTWRISHGPLWTDLALGPQLVRLSLAGKDLGSARNVARWGAAGQVRARVGWSIGPMAFFVSASAGRSFVRDRLTLDDAPDNTYLSPWDASLGAGLTILLGG